MLESYLENIFEAGKAGDATEPSYYPTLEKLLEEFADSTGKRHILVTTLPRKTEAGNPDFSFADYLGTGQYRQLPGFEALAVVAAPRAVMI